MFTMAERHLERRYLALLRFQLVRKAEEYVKTRVLQQESACLRHASDAHRNGRKKFTVENNGRSGHSLVKVSLLGI